MDRCNLLFLRLKSMQLETSLLMSAVYWCLNKLHIRELKYVDLHLSIKVAVPSKLWHEIFLIYGPHGCCQVQTKVQRPFPHWAPVLLWKIALEKGFHVICFHLFDFCLSLPVALFCSAVFNLFGIFIVCIVLTAEPINFTVYYYTLNGAVQLGATCWGSRGNNLLNLIKSAFVLLWGTAFCSHHL